MPRPLTRVLTRQVPTLQHGEIVIVIALEGIYFRKPRQRTKFLLPYGVGYQRAVAINVEPRGKRKAKGRKGVKRV